MQACVPGMRRSGACTHTCSHSCSCMYTDMCIPGQTMGRRQSVAPVGVSSTKQPGQGQGTAVASKLERQSSTLHTNDLTFTNHKVEHNCIGQNCISHNCISHTI